MTNLFGYSSGPSVIFKYIRTLTLFLILESTELLLYKHTPGNMNYSEQSRIQIHMSVYEM
mgnify:CR=1 FL=1